MQTQSLSGLSIVSGSWGQGYPLQSGIFLLDNRLQLLCFVCVGLFSKLFNLLFNHTAMISTAVWNLRSQFSGEAGSFGHSQFTAQRWCKNKFAARGNLNSVVDFNLLVVCNYHVLI